MQETLKTLLENNSNQIKGANNLRMGGIGEVGGIVLGGAGGREGWKVMRLCIY